MLYCRKEHRGRGIASAVEARLARRNLLELRAPLRFESERCAFRTDVRPFKSVAAPRPRVIAMSRDSPLWTELTAADGSPLHFHCTIRSRKLRPRIHIFED